MNVKTIGTIAAFIVALLLGGCGGSLFTNYTPQQVPQNPSGIYTISMSPRVSNSDMIKDTYSVDIVIDGREEPMEESALGKKIYDYEFTMPAGQNEAKYYFKVKYLAKVEGNIREKEHKSPLYSLELINRYIISLQSSRGPVGATIPVIGRGFSKYDVIGVGDTEAATDFISSNTLSFTVPALEPNKTYPVVLKSGEGETLISNFLVDPSQLSIAPYPLAVESQERGMIVLSITNPAPQDGVPIRVSTDSPRSILMEQEFTIPAGARSISVPYEGGEVGDGLVYFEAPGFRELEVPLSVNNSAGPVNDIINEGLTEQPSA